MHITKLEIWIDTGYVEGGIEVPSLSDTLPEADRIYTDLHPSREDIFSAVRIKDTYANLINASYLRLTFSDLDYPIYAWVDQVSVISDTPEPVTRIAWHIDLWRTYLGQAKFGYGLVSRRPRGTDDPIQLCSYRYRRVFDEKTIIPKPSNSDGSVYWVILNAAIENSSSDEVNSVQLWCPIVEGRSGPIYFQFWGGDELDRHSAVYPAPSWLNWLRGQGADCIGLSATQVSSAFISPIPPDAVLSGDGTQNDPIKLNDPFYGLFGGGMYDVKGKEGVYMLYKTSFGSYAQHKYSVDFETTDTREIVITDLTGIPVGVVPWGMHVTEIYARPVVSATSAYVELRADGTESASEGLRWVIPLPPVDITSNSWSDYLYSGQRDYDLRQRDIAARQALVRGIVGAGESTVSAGIMGGIGAGVTGRQASQISELIQGTKISGRGAGFKKAQLVSGINDIIGSAGGIGALGSAGAMLGVSVGSALISYALTTHFNQELRSATDQLQAKQIDSIQIPGGGWDWMDNGTPVSAFILTPDDYSLERFSVDIGLNGISCSEPTPDCTALIRAGGPLKISQLVVTGDIPAEAKKTISKTLDKGVRIVAKNKETEVKDE